MAHAARWLIVLSVLLLTAGRGDARCGDRPGDDEAVAAVQAEVAAHCDCCSSSTRAEYARCVVGIARAAVDAGSLPRGCAGPVVRPNVRACHPRAPECATGGCFDPIGLACTGQPCSPDHPCTGSGVRCTPRCAPTPECTSDAGCDDGNGCTFDRCIEGTCQHDCVCVGPSGGAACCPGPSAGGDYFFTCGDPVCRGHTITGLPPCTTEKAGEPCCSIGAQCDPGDDCNRLLVCATSDPTNGGMCPISLRSYKQNVEYLSDDDVKRLHDELLRFKLATYQYKAPADSSATRLGFIIDDVGPSPAVDPSGQRVDLYAYTSMAVAALQQQAHEIEELKRQVAVLEGQLKSAQESPARPR